MGLEPTYLADRAPQLARFKHYLAGFPGLPRNVRVTGLRGVGKTVLLQQYGRLAEEAGWIVVGRECNEHLQEESIFGQALVEDCRRAVEQTGAYAFHIQFVGALLWDAVEWPLRITKVDFDQHRPTILEALDGAFFEARLARTSGTERSLLRAMATSGESAQIHDVLKLTRLPNQTAQQLIARLRDKGLIYRPQRGRLAFTVPLFGDYMRRASRIASRGSV